MFCILSFLKNSLTIKVESDVETKMHQELYKLKNNYDLSLLLILNPKIHLLDLLKDGFLMLCMIQPLLKSLKRVK